MKERRSGPLPVALAVGILAALGTSCLRGRANDDPRGASKAVRARVVPVVSRTIHREVVLLFGWGRAVLMQLAHPLVAQGVAEHSAFRAEAFGGWRRLHRLPLR